MWTCKEPLMCYACIANCTVYAIGQAQLTAKLMCCCWELSTCQLCQCKQLVSVSSPALNRACLFCSVCMCAPQVCTATDMGTATCMTRISTMLPSSHVCCQWQLSRSCSPFCVLLVLTAVVIVHSLSAIAGGCRQSCLDVTWRSSRRVALAAACLA
jgi:hypothetical protein